MDPVLIAVILLALLFVLMFIGVHIAIALGLVSILGLFWYGGEVEVRGGILLGYLQMKSFALSAAPMFILMGAIVYITGIGGQLFDASAKWMGRLPGGLANASVVACAIFAAMCGVSIAGASTVGQFAIPEMKKRGYHNSLATGTVAAAGALSILIPPSITFILYGTLTGTSVGALFIAGIIPGMMLALMMMCYITARALITPAVAPTIYGYTWKDRFTSLKYLWPTLLLIVLVLGAIYAGVTTPTEAAAIGVVGSLIISVIPYKALSWAKFKEVFRDAIVINGMILIITISASMFSHLLILLGTPRQILNLLTGLQITPWMALIFICILLIILGMFLDGISLMLISLPLLFPIATMYKFDPLLFGVIMTITIEIGVITPPVGMNVFVIKGIARDVPLLDIYKGAQPFVLLECLAIAIMYLFPSIVVWLPHTIR